MLPRTTVIAPLRAEGTRDEPPTTPFTMFFPASPRPARMQREAGSVMAVSNSHATTWRGLFRFPQARFRGLAMTGEALSDLHQFIWKQGRNVVVLIKEEDAWKVSYSTDSRLLGPRRLVYQASHRVAKHAAWDVMARVIRASHNEDEGLRAAKQAAQWMRRVEAAGSARA